MGIVPNEVISDLEAYVKLYGIDISKEAKRTFEDIEEFSFNCNYPCNHLLFFSKAIRNTKELKKLFYSKYINPNLVALILEIGFYRSIDTETNYQRGTKLYSNIHHREKHDKTAILDKALQYCVKDERTTLENRDIILATIDYFEGLIECRRELWVDNGLDIEFVTLAHVYGLMDENLSLKLSEIREWLLGSSYWRVKMKLV